MEVVPVSDSLSSARVSTVIFPKNLDVLYIALHGLMAATVI
jgi:hypothetical protein